MSTSIAKPIFSGPLTTVRELEQGISSSPDGIRILDGSWYMDKTRNPKQDFEQGHIPGACYFDIDDISDKAQDLPHMLPSETTFGQKVSELGIANDHAVVVYTKTNSFSAARCWWMFQCFGHEKVHVLDGGLPAWVAAGGQLETGKAEPVSTRPSSGLVQPKGNTWLLSKGGFQPKLQPHLMKTWRQVLSASESGEAQVVDARSMARFLGQAPEPRAGLAGGHIPGSVCVPFTEVVEEGWTTFKSPEAIRQAFAKAGVDVDSPKPIITTCGSGVTAGTLALALHLCGRDIGATAVYDGSWSEWGAREDLPKTTTE